MPCINFLTLAARKTPHPPQSICLQFKIAVDLGNPPEEVSFFPGEFPAAKHILPTNHAGIT